MTFKLKVQVGCKQQHFQESSAVLKGLWYPERLRKVHPQFKT